MKRAKRVVGAPVVRVASPAYQPESGQTVAVITCHNYARYLRACLDSCLNQSHPFAQVVVVDDSSTDGTEALVASYGPRVVYVRGEWADACHARNAGAAAAGRSSFLLFVDADNILSSDYHAKLLTAMADGAVAVAYGHLLRFDDAGHDLGRSPYIKPFDHAALRLGNHIDTCALVRREAFEQVGGWCPGYPSGYQDWSLWLRITKAGWRAKLVEEAGLFYRVHPLSMSAATHADEWRGVAVMSQAMRLSVVTLFSGRAWMLERYFAFLASLDWHHANLHLVAVDNSCDPDFSQALQARLLACGLSFTYLRAEERILSDVSAAAFTDSAKHRVAHQYQMNAHLARLYAQAREVMPAGTDLVWTLEDDLTGPPDTLKHLARGLYLHKQAGAVTSCVRSRFQAKLIAWQYQGVEHWDCGSLTEAPAAGSYLDIDGSGFHSTLWRRAAFDQLAFRPSRGWGEAGAAYDWAAMKTLQEQGWRLLLSGSARLDHHQKDGGILKV